MNNKGVINEKNFNCCRITNCFLTDIFYCVFAMRPLWAGYFATVGGVYIIQVNIFGNYTIAGVKPNLFVIYVLFIGLFANQVLGISLGVVFGLILDFLYGFLGNMGWAILLFAAFLRLAMFPIANKSFENIWRIYKWHNLQIGYWK